MIKAEKHIERDLFTMLKASSLAEEISGEVFREGQRPDGRSVEDVVVRFLAGTDGQIQSGTVVLNVYVTDIVSVPAKKPVEDIARVEMLENLILEFVRGNRSSEYLLSTSVSPTSYEVPGIGQHVIAARIDFQRVTD